MNFKLNNKMEIGFHRRIKPMTKIEQLYSLSLVYNKKKKISIVNIVEKLSFAQCEKHNYGAKSCKKINYYACEHNYGAKSCKKNQLLYL